MAFLNENGLAFLWNQMLARLNNFVPFEAGKGLSTNDYTNEEKEKLNNIDENANNYILPVGGSAIGGVKNGGSIKIDSAGKMNISDGTVTRAKLANDALYSPIKNISDTTYSISIDDIGKTLKPSNYNANLSITLPSAVASALPYGAEIAVLRWGNSGSQLITITHEDGGYFQVTGKGGASSVSISEPIGMIAIKKITTSWLVTGNVEVVS